MRYYVIADPHGFCTLCRQALEAAGYFSDSGDRRLIVCGDALDRGEQTQATVELLLEQKRAGRLIFLAGNHEDLLTDALQEIARGGIYDIADGMSHHFRNGTWNTLLHLSGMRAEDAVKLPGELVRRVRSSPFYRELLLSSEDYYETAHYIFCHGWLPTHIGGSRSCPQYTYDADWRNASREGWRQARWLNGMELACRYDIREPGKTVVCGHFHTSYGHAKLEHKGSEFGPDADFSPFSAPGILALDACTAVSGRVNCVVLTDNDP